MAIAPKHGIELSEKPTCTLRSNGSIMADDGDNVIWYIGYIDGKRVDFEYHVKTDRWFEIPGF